MSSEFMSPHYSIYSGWLCSGHVYQLWGELWWQLDRGEYDMFKHTPIFKSGFIQTSKRGDMVDVHNHSQTVTQTLHPPSLFSAMLSCCCPDQPQAMKSMHATHDWVIKERGCKHTKTLGLSRLLPLKFGKQQVYMKLATGKAHLSL